MIFQKLHKFYLLFALALLLVFCVPKSEKSLYPFGQELRTLSEDLESQAYKDVVETMIFQDLREEWKRVATPDNYLVFLEKHGGIEKINADLNLKAA